MAIWEVTIRGCNVCAEFDEDDEPNPVLAEETHSLAVEGDDLVQILMQVQERLESLNARVAQKIHRAQSFDDGREFKVIGVVETDLRRLDDKWVDKMIVDVEFSKEQCQWPS